LVLLLPCTSCATLAKKDDDKEDHYGLVKGEPRKVLALSGLLVFSATACQMVTPGWLGGVLGDAAASPVGKTALKCAAALQEQRRSNPLGMVLAHGIAAKASADVIAQTIPQMSAASIWLDPLRVFRSMLASVLSTSLPFYYWTKIMPLVFRGYKPWVQKAMAAPLAKVFSSTFITSLLKTLFTQLTFRPFNVLAFLALKSIFGGDSARQLVAMLRSKFKQSVIGGIAFYFVSNLIMYSIPVPFLHPIMGSVAGLIFNVWLAIIAYSKSS